MVRALTLIACRQDYFSSACFVAFLVIEKQPVHLTYLTSVLLPWNPKTEAPPAQRISLVRQLISKNDTLAWKLIQSLLPNQSTVSGDFIKPTYLACDFEKHFAFTVPETYYEESKKYLDLAIEMSAGQTSRLLFLIDLLDDVPEDTFYNIAIIIEHTAASLDDEGKYGLWNKLLNFVNRHWQYPNASWALSKEALSRLQQTIASIAPQNEQVQLRRLFQNNCSFIFPERTEDYRKEGSKLDSLRLKSVEKYVEKYGIDNFIQCTEQFESVYPVGKVLADSRLTTQCDPRIFQWLSSENEKHRKIGRDYAFSRFRTCEISWVEQQLSNASDIQKANLLAALPLTNEILTLVTARLSYKAQIQYWKRLSPWYITSKDNMNLAAQKFIQYDRPYDALELVTNTLQADECALPFSTLFKLLQQIVAKQNKEQNSAHAYQIVMLIEYLQENWDDQNAVALLEWQYYNLFESYGDKGPQSLYYALGNNPESFITLLCCTFKGRHEERTPANPEKSKIAEHALDIIFRWNIFPWVRKNGEVDHEKLKNWFEQVKKASIEKDRYEVAMTTIGGILFYAPKDPDGLFIDKAVAELLHTEESDKLRNGYLTKAISSRGVHFVDPTGAPEFELERKYTLYAQQVDELGFFRFAKTLRVLAQEYHQEAVNNIEEENKWSNNP